jgi:hypothetical protein
MSFPPIGVPPFRRRTFLPVTPEQSVRLSPQRLAARPRPSGARSEVTPPERRPGAGPQRDASQASPCASEPQMPGMIWPDALLPRWTALCFPFRELLRAAQRRPRGSGSPPRGGLLPARSTNRPAADVQTVARYLYMAKGPHPESHRVRWSSKQTAVPRPMGPADQPSVTSAHWSCGPSNRSLRQAPLSCWSLDDPLSNWAAGAASHATLSFKPRCALGSDRRTRRRSRRAGQGRGPRQAR